MTRVFALPPRENWIVDRFCEEFAAHNKDIVVNYPAEADVVWLTGEWYWDQLPTYILQSKKVLTSIHHIVPEKFDEKAKFLFKQRDKITDVYHVPCQKTHDQIRHLTEKEIRVHPFWVNDTLFKKLSMNSEERLEQRAAARQKLNLKQDAFYVMSAQRDTEGCDLATPKLEKGPDLLCDVIKKISSTHEQTRVLLGAWRRQYVMNRLSEEKIEFDYFELPKYETLIDMYHASDLYVVSSRYEGGPQAVVECATMNVPIVSTDVGVASEVLHPNSLYDPSNDSSVLDAVNNAMKPETIKHNQNNVSRLYVENCMPWFRHLISDVEKR
jgi:glycosyltransferase involved in cell wall biosynthesis